MRLALLTDGLFPEVIGGIQKHSTLLAEHLPATGISVDAFAPHSSTERVPGTCASVIRVPSPAFDRLPGKYLRQRYRYSKNLANMQNIDWMSYDLIYIQGFSGWELLLQKKNGRSLPPTIVNFHGLGMFQRFSRTTHGLSRFAFRSNVRNQIRLSDYCQSLGGHLTKILTGIVARERIIELGIALPSDFACHPDVALDFARPRVCTFIGRYDKCKGLGILHSAIRKTAPEKTRFRVIGPIPESQKVDMHNVAYLGQISDTSVIRAELLRSDVLICPSYSEGMPTVVLEAMATANAIIATDVGATRELVDSTNGWLVNPGSVSSLVYALQHVNSMNGEGLAKMKLASLNRFLSERTWDVLSRQMKSKFDDICSAHIPVPMNDLELN